MHIVGITEMINIHMLNSMYAIVINVIIVAILVLEGLDYYVCEIMKRYKRYRNVYVITLGNHYLYTLR